MKIAVMLVVIVSCVACELPATPPAQDAQPSCDAACLDVCPDDAIATDGACMRCAGGSLCAVPLPCDGYCDPGALRFCDESGTNCLCQIPSGGTFACVGSGR